MTAIFHGFSNVNHWRYLIKYFVQIKPFLLQGTFSGLIYVATVIHYLCINVIMHDDFA